MELERLERSEKLELDRRKLRNFQKEIEETFNNNLDEKLIEFIDVHDLEINNEIIYYLRKYNQFLKAR